MTTEFIDDVQLDERIKKVTQEPIKYKVVLLNDDQTPVEGVVKVFTEIFKHTNIFYNIWLLVIIYILQLKI